MFRPACIFTSTLSKVALEVVFKSKPNPNNFISKKYSVRALSMSAEAKKLKCEPVKIGTHNGIFHCDEVLACFMLQQLDKYKNAKIIRTRNLDILSTCDIVVDVGAVFDVETNRFDHHQRSFNETLSSLRPEIGKNYHIKLSSAGLIYTYFGEEVINSILKKNKNITLEPDSLRIVFKRIYEGLIEEIDGIDNGVPICDGVQSYQINTHLSARVGNLYPAWDCEEKLDEMEQFEKAKELVGETFVDKVLYYSISWLKARDIVRDAIKNSEKVYSSGEILELSRSCPWKEHLFDLEVEYNIVGKPKYVIVKQNEDDWRVICVPIKPTSFICRKFLHKDWRGLRTEIAKLSNIEGVQFCHVTGFIGGATSRDGVLNMAIQSLNGDYTD